MTTSALPPTGGPSPLGDDGTSGDGKAIVKGSSSGREYKSLDSSKVEKVKRPRSPVTPPEPRKKITKEVKPKTDGGTHKERAMAALRARPGVSEADMEVYAKKIEKNPELWAKRLTTPKGNDSVWTGGEVARKEEHAKAREEHAKARETREQRKHKALMEKADELLQSFENKKQERAETKPIIDMVKKLCSEIKSMERESFLIKTLWVKEYADTGKLPSWAIEYTQTGRLPHWVEDYLVTGNLPEGKKFNHH